MEWHDHLTTTNRESTELFSRDPLLERIIQMRYASRLAKQYPGVENAAF